MNGHGLTVADHINNAKAVNEYIEDIGLSKEVKVIYNKKKEIYELKQWIKNKSKSKVIITSKIILEIILVVNQLASRKGQYNE